MNLNTDLIAALGPIPRGELRVLTALVAGTIGSSGRAPDGWLRGRAVRLQDMEGLDTSAALKRLRRRASGWPVRITTAPLLGVYIEAAPDWPGLPEPVRRQAMAKATAAIPQIMVPNDDPSAQAPANIGYMLRREKAGAPSVVQVIRLQSGVYHEKVLATARDEASGRILLALIARGQRLGLKEGAVVLEPVDATPADAVDLENATAD
ncbi:hypothetical protein V8J36_05215 [Frigidibacter sp. MR17.14]|uniref:hypothetical protein n=1 Tax=Frigidibacter sp. MR17.14 TaxID=3126509 RepID=UPI003012FE32